MDIELEKMQKVNEILQLCLAINGFEHRQQEKTGEKPTVLFEFSGHIAMLTVNMYENGWHEEIKADKCFYIMLDSSYQYIDEPMEVLDDCIHYLKSIEMRWHDEHLQQAV